MRLNSCWSISSGTLLYKLYYSSFYAVSALLASKGLNSKTHKCVNQLFNSHFVHKGIATNEMNRLFSQLFDMRQNADYEDFVEYSKSDVEPLMEPVRDFIATIGNLLQQG